MSKTSRVFRPPPLGKLRFASVEDAPIILGLINESMSKTFRVHCTQQIEYLIENCVLSICQMDFKDMLVGFLAARDYPSMPSVHPRAWEEYIWTKYKAVELNARNTLFIHLMCWNTIYCREIVDNMLKSIFMHDPYLQYIAMLKTVASFPLLVPGHVRTESSFRRVYAMEKGIPGDHLPTLYIADRNEVNPRLRIRRAVEEDNDDIVPIMEAHTARIRELYGDFYVSELVSRHPESERVLLVCEHKEEAVGVMSLNTQINFEALEESFELSPFSGLRKLDCPPTQKHKDLDSNVSVTSMNRDASLLEETLSRSKDEKTRQVTWVFDEDEFKTFREPPSIDHMFPDQTPAQLDILNLLEDEEELEFDIINIDTDLMRVPEMLFFEEEDLGTLDPLKRIILNGHPKDSIVDDKKKEKLKGANAAATTKPIEPTRYSGTSNAFLLELFSMHQDYDERYGFDMLEAAFELFPDRDYCVICFPSNHASFPLLEHFTLVTAYSTRMRFINETLYVAHVNSVRGNIRVRAGEATDIRAMYDICERSPIAQTLIGLFESSLTSNSLDSYVFLSENQPVGMAVLGPLEESTTIRTQFDLEPEPRRPGTDGMVLTSIISPVLEPHFRWFSRELLRESQYSTLFWLCKLFSRGDMNPVKHLISIAGHMTPVHPRHLVPNISGNKDLDKIYKDISIPFALWMLERPLTSLPKVYVNSSIVVVGASRTALAFLETLLMGPTCPYLTFSNVTLVSEHGLPTVSECLRAADTCVPRDGRYTDRYLKSVPFFFYLDVMTAVMVGIDRKKKCIHLKGGGVKYYDELVLTCGQQFQHPDYLHGPMQLVKEVELGKPCERLLMDNPQYKPDKVPHTPELPENVMLINSLFEANVCLKKLLHMISDTNKGDPHGYLSVENQIIVYGDCIEAYSCIAALLELGIFAEMITFVDPFPPDDPVKLRINCFNNETIDERVQKSIEELGIRVYRKYYLTGWQHHENHVESINLMSHLYYTTLPCFALFYYGIKAIDVSAFKAINESGLVYDGGLVVGTSFETNDPNVFGAGTCVKYSRKLYADPRAHQFYCSEDIGESLATMFLNKLDPFVMGSPDTPTNLMPRYSSTMLNFSYKGSMSRVSSTSRLSIAASKMFARWQPVLKFESPLVQSATFPGPLHYMKLKKPGIEIPMEVQQSLPHQGHTLVTDKNGNYFRLQLNVLHCVNAVTCLTKKPFSCEILSQLYGKHEALFNKLLTRFKMGLIDDLFEFFTQPWMSAIYQEPFQDLMRDINDQDIGTVHDLVGSKHSISEDDTYLSIIASKMFTGSLSCSDIPGCAFGSKEAQSLGTFRSLIENFVARRSSNDNSDDSKADIPSECGQSAIVRSEAYSSWKTIEGERIVAAHLNKYLIKNSVVNSHYASPDPKYA